MSYIMCETLQEFYVLLLFRDAAAERRYGEIIFGDKPFKGVFDTAMEGNRREALRGTRPAKESVNPVQEEIVTCFKHHLGVAREVLKHMVLRCQHV